MGGQRFATNQAEVFEAADPRRTMPKWLVIGTIIAVIVLVVLMSWLNKRSLEQPDETSNTVVAENSAEARASGGKTCCPTRGERGAGTGRSAYCNRCSLVTDNR